MGNIETIKFRTNEALYPNKKRSIREKWRIGDGSGKDEGFLFFMEAWIARWLFVAKVGICRRKVARFPARLATGV